MLASKRGAKMAPVIVSSSMQYIIFVLPLFSCAFLFTGVSVGEELSTLLFSLLGSLLEEKN